MATLFAPHHQIISLIFIQIDVLMQIMSKQISSPKIYGKYRICAMSADLRMRIDVCDGGRRIATGAYLPKECVHCK